MQSGGAEAEVELPRGGGPQGERPRDVCVPEEGLSGGCGVCVCTGLRWVLGVFGAGSLVGDPRSRL